MKTLFRIVLFVGFLAQSLSLPASACVGYCGPCWETIWGGAPACLYDVDTGKSLVIEGPIVDLAYTSMGRDTADVLYLSTFYSATVHDEPDYSGSHTWKAGAAFDQIHDLGQTALGANQAASIRLYPDTCDGASGLYLYSKPDFKGRCARFLEGSHDLRMSNLGPYGARSARVVGAFELALYSGLDHNGTVAQLPGSERDFANTALGGSRAYSMRIGSGLFCDGEPGVELWSEDNFTGVCSKITRSINDLSETLVGDDQTSSVALEGGYIADVYRSPNRPMGGTRSRLLVSDPSLADEAVGDDAVSSVEVLLPENELGAVWRAQIRLLTDDRGDAGTDDNVFIGLNRDNGTWLDYGRDDFEEGDDFTYDLLLDGVKRVADIDYLLVSKDGDDGWCPSRIQLLINEAVIFTHEGQPCRWLDNDGLDERDLLFPHHELREHPSWIAYDAPEFGGILTHDSVVSRIETAVGNFTYGQRVYWGELHGPAVEYAVIDDKTIDVDLDLASDFLGFEVEVDANVHLQFQCNQALGRLQIVSVFSHIDVDPDWYEYLFTIGLVGILDALGSGRTLDAIPEVTLDLGGNNCPIVQVQQNKNILILPQ